MGLFLLLLLVMAVAALVFGAWVVVTVVTAVVTAVLAVGGEALPVLMILAGAWLVWRALADNRRHRRRDARRAGQQLHQWAGGGPPAGASADRKDRPARRGKTEPASVPASQPRPMPRRDLPIDVQVKAEQIQRKADLLLGYADRFPPFSQSLHIVRQTAADYLPRTIEAYLALPGLSDPIVPTTGRTALTELRAQLQLLDVKLDDITLDLQQQDLDRMSANRRFLEERFGVGTAAESAQSPTPSPSQASLDHLTPPRTSAGVGPVAAS